MFASGRGITNALMKKKEYYLVTTSHLLDKLLFKCREDFIAGMNYVAVTAYTQNIVLLAFILMSNHMHFVLECSRQEAELFITRLKERYGGYYCNKYGEKNILKGVDVDIQELDSYGESLEQAIAYVIMNSVAARITVDASGYPWGSGACFFNSNRITGRPVSSLSGRECARLFRSRTAPNPSWVVDEDGCIDPRTVVNTGFVEQRYRSSARMRYFLGNSSKAKAALERSGLPSFKDQSILQAVEDLCVSLFQKTGVDALSRTQAGELLRQLRRRFSADVGQLCRITGLSYEDATLLLEEF